VLWLLVTLQQTFLARMSSYELIWAQKVHKVQKLTSNLRFAKSCLWLLWKKLKSCKRCESLKSLKANNDGFLPADLEGNGGLDVWNGYFHSFFTLLHFFVIHPAWLSPALSLFSFLACHSSKKLKSQKVFVQFTDDWSPCSMLTYKYRFGDDLARSLGSSGLLPARWHIL